MTTVTCAPHRIIAVAGGPIVGLGRRAHSHIVGWRHVVGLVSDGLRGHGNVGHWIIGHVDASFAITAVHAMVVDDCGLVVSAYGLRVAVGEVWGAGVIGVALFQLLPLELCEPFLLLSFAKHQKVERPYDHSPDHHWNDPPSYPRVGVGHESRWWRWFEEMSG